MQRNLGSCKTIDIAVAMLCPVVSKYPENRKLLIHGGAIHFSKEKVQIKERSIFGELAGKGSGSWKVLNPPHFMNSISQEHGIIEQSGKWFDQLNLGDPVYILPAHSCLTANLMRKYRTLEGEIITTMNS
jgi:D-serine deaminase-like pyridoxal phosphate-dependent protein